MARRQLHLRRPRPARRAGRHRERGDLLPVDKVALGESPSVAMHVPVPTLRQNPNGGPCNSQELGAAAMRMDEKRSSGGVSSGASRSGPSSDDDSCDYAFGEANSSRVTSRGRAGRGATALTLRAVLMTASALTAAAGMRQPGS